MNDDLKTAAMYPEVPQAPAPSNDDPLLSLRRMTIRTSYISAKRPYPPRELKSSVGKYSWQPPKNAQGITHWNLYANDELHLVRQLPVDQLFLEDNLDAKRVFISSWNATMKLESARIEIQGTVRPDPDEPFPLPGDLLPIGDEPFWVSECTLVNFSDGSQRDRFEVRYNPPDPLGSFSGVKAWVQRADGEVEFAGAHDYQGDGTEGIPGRYGIFLLDLLPPEEDEDWNFFLTVRSANYDEPLDLDTEPYVTRLAFAATPSTMPEIPPAPPVTVDSIAVREIYVGEFEVTLHWTPHNTSTPANFTGVVVYLEDPDTSAQPNAPMDGSVPLDGSVQLSGDWQPEIVMNNPRSPLAFRIKGHPKERPIRVYLAAYNEVANAQIVRANLPDPTPNAVVTVPASSVNYISGMEHTWLITNPVVEVQEDFNNSAGAKYRLTFDFTPPDTTIPLPPGMKPCGGVQIVYIANDVQSRGPVLEVNKKDTWISPAYDAGNHYFTVAFCSMDIDGFVNSYVKDVTPVVDVQVIYPPTGEGTSPDVTQFKVANPRHSYEPDGTIYAVADLQWNPPASNRYAGVKFFVRGTTPPRELGSASWNQKSLTVWIIDWPKVAENWVILAIPFDVQGKLSDDPANPSARIPTAVWNIGPPGSGSSGQEFAPLVNVAGVVVTADQQLSPDGIPMMRFHITGWTNPTDNKFGGVSIARIIGGYTDRPVYWDAQKTDTSFVTPWEPAVNSTTMEFYFVSRDMTGHRNSLTFGLTPKVSFGFIPIPSEMVPDRIPGGWWNEAEFSWPTYPADAGFIVDTITAKKIFVGSILRVGGGNTPSTNASFGSNENGQIAVYNASNVIRAWMGQQDSVAHPGEPTHSVFGGWFAELYVGGRSPNNAPLYANQNGVLILGGFDFISDGGTGMPVYPYLSVRDIFGAEKARVGARLNYGLPATDPYGEPIPDIAGVWTYEMAIGGQSLADWRILSKRPLNPNDIYETDSVQIRNINKITIDYPAYTGSPSSPPYRMDLGMDVFGTDVVQGRRFPGIQFERKTTPGALTGHRATLLNRGLVCFATRGSNPVTLDQRAAIYSFNGDSSGGDTGSWWGEITLRGTTGNESVRISGYDSATGVGPVMLMSYSSSTVKLSTKDGVYTTAKVQANSAFNVGGTDVINSSGSFVGSSVNTAGSVSAGGFVYKPTGQSGQTTQVNVGHPLSPSTHYLQLYFQGGLFMGVASVPFSASDLAMRAQTQRSK